MRKKMGVFIAVLILIGIPLAVNASESGNANIKSCS